MSTNKKNKGSFSFKKLTSSQKASLFKSLGLILIVIVGFSILSKTLFSGGKTLAEYAQDNPDLAYKESENIPGESDSSLQPVPENEPDTTETVPETTPETGTEDSTETTLETTPETEEHISPERVTYKEDFYYEPLSDDLMAFITGVSYPADGADEISYDDLVYVHVLHYNFDGEIVDGELICNKAIAQDFVEIFYELYVAEYQIEKMRLIDYYDGDDTASMLDNNTSCFNYRTVDNTTSLSKHALGLAIDINPFYNPYVRFTNDGGTIISPEGSEAYADREADFPYKIDSNDLCYQLFIEHGFIWGGNWNSSKDYQHFQKVIE